MTSQEELDLMFETANELLHKKETIITNNLNDRERCANLNCLKESLINDYSNGIIVCTACGTIKEDRMIDDSPEWNFGADAIECGQKDPARCGMPVNPLLERSSVSTIITGGKNNYFMKRLHMQMSMDYVERSRWHIFNGINKKCEHLSSAIAESSKHFYVEMSKHKLSRGNVRKGLIACCIYYACKHHNVSRSIKEIACLCDITPAILNNANKIFQDIMKGHINEELFNEEIKVDDLTSRFCTYLNLQKQDRILVIKEIKRMNDIIENSNILIGKTPSAITAGILLYVLTMYKIPFQKKNASIQLNVSIVTLNKVIQLINNNKSMFDH